MNVNSRLAIIASVFSLMAGGVSAATYTFTEGDGNNRKRVEGSMDLEDANRFTPGFELDDLAGVGAGFGQSDVVQLHGRIVSQQDVFSYTFAFSGGFKVEFDLDGYLLANGFTSSNGNQFESLSGLVGQYGRGGNPQAGLFPVKSVLFTLASSTSSVSRAFETDVLFGDNPFIFSGVGGVDYTLTVDGSVGPTARADALYDLKISAVPLPAGVFLLLGGLGGLATLRRRKGQTQA